MKVNSVPDSPSMPLLGKLAIPFIDFRASELQDSRLTGRQGRIGKGLHTQRRVNELAARRKKKTICGLDLLLLMSSGWMETESFPTKGYLVQFSNFQFVINKYIRVSSSSTLSFLISIGSASTFCFYHLTTIILFWGILTAHDFSILLVKKENPLWPNFRNFLVKIQFRPSTLLPSVHYQTCVVSIRLQSYFNLP